MLQHEHQSRPVFLTSFNEKDEALRVMLKDQLHSISELHFKGEYDLCTVIVFFEAVELLF